MVTFGKIRDKGFTKAEVIDLLDMSQPTFDKRLKDKKWNPKEIRLFKRLGIWD